MTDTVGLGEITCPSGELVLMDGGYLGLWSGDRSPDEVQQPDQVSAVDLEIVGPDAGAAARSFDRQSGRMLYDIPRHGVEEFTAMFVRHCRERDFAASLRAFDQRVPHRERVHRAITEADPDFLITGVPVVAIGGLPTDRPLAITALPAPEFGWAQFHIHISDEPAASVTSLGSIGVDWARLVFADADALTAWVHDDPIDGLADVVFWGRDEDAVAAEFAATRSGTTGDDRYGWLNLPARQAYEKAVALQQRRDRVPDQKFAFDFRPHSHHWRVMADVRASTKEAATIDVGGARLMFAMTTVGDGFFPVHVQRNASGTPTTIQVTVQDAQPPEFGPN